MSKDCGSLTCTMRVSRGCLELADITIVIGLRGGGAGGGCCSATTNEEL